MTVRIVPLTQANWHGVRHIYAAGIAPGHATFETEPPDWAAFDAGKLADHRLVAVDENEAVLGWAAVSPVSNRAVYAGVVKDSVYVAPDAQGHGVGRLLLDELVISTEAAGIWTIQSGVFAENVASLRLHEHAGFRVVGTRQRLGRMAYGPLAGHWRDVILLERRSEVAGRA